MLKIISIAALTVLLAGCAAFNNLQNQVSTYGPWPAERKPDTCVFERLPSQRAHPEHEQLLETAALPALEAAGFRAVSDAEHAEYLMQLGAKVVSNDPWIYNDPLFWHDGWVYGSWGRGGPYPGVIYPGAFGPGYGWGYYGRGFADERSFQREVVLIIRDRKTGQLLYEARASNIGFSPSIDALLPAMFSAAMNDFPSNGPNPREVTVPIVWSK